MGSTTLVRATSLSHREALDSIDDAMMRARRAAEADGGDLGESLAWSAIAANELALRVLMGRPS